MDDPRPPPWLEELSQEFRERFAFEKLLGAGVSSCVYRARQADLDRSVVVKLLRLEFELESPMAKRFAREAKLLVPIDHPRVIRLLDHGMERGAAYSVYPDEEGEALDSWLRGRVPMEPEEARAILVDVFEGLQAIHDAGVVHRDLKPANLLRLPDGRIKLLDFGLARKYVEESTLTRTGRILGTPNYMSPAQILQHDVEPADDLYAAGVIGYELLFAENPFSAGDLAQTLQNHVSRQVDAPHLRDPSIPLGLSLVIGDCLAKKRNERPRSAERARERLLEPDAPAPAGAEGASTIPDTAPDPRPSTESWERELYGSVERLRRSPLFLRGAVGLCLACFLGGFLLRLPGGPPPEPTGREEVDLYPLELERAMLAELDELWEMRRGPGGKVLRSGDEGFRADRPRLLSTDPLEVAGNLARQLSLRQWFRWLEEGGRPEELPRERVAALERIDSVFRDVQLDPPFAPFLRTVPSAVAVLPDEEEKRGEGKVPGISGPFQGWLGAARKIQQELVRRQAELRLRLLRALREERWEEAPEGFQPFYVLMSVTRRPSDFDDPYVRLTMFYNHRPENRRALQLWFGRSALDVRRLFYAVARSVREEPETRELAALCLDFWSRRLRQEMLGPLLHAPAWFVFGREPELPAEHFLEGLRRSRAFKVDHGRAEREAATFEAVVDAWDRAAAPGDGSPAARLRQQAARDRRSTYRRDPELDRLNQVVTRVLDGSPGPPTDPAAIDELLERAPELADWYARLARRGALEFLPPPRREGLERIDVRFRARGLTPPFQAFLRARPSGEPVMPGSRETGGAFTVEPPGGLRGWLGAARLVVQRLLRGQPDRVERLQRALSGGEATDAPAGFSLFWNGYKLFRPKLVASESYPVLPRFYLLGPDGRRALIAWFGPAADDVRLLFHLVGRSLREEPATRDLAAALFHDWLELVKREALGVSLHAPGWFAFGGSLPGGAAAAFAEACRLELSHELDREGAGVAIVDSAGLVAAWKRAAGGPYETEAARWRYRRALHGCGAAFSRTRDAAGLLRFLEEEAETIEGLPQADRKACLGEFARAATQMRSEKGVAAELLEPLEEKLDSLYR